ncbi:hypothetical protein M2451_003046 [Dysgonomonas sp. PFB1-18]|uniref:hypothetical protein n=1 Tax=unclassified Dysgonomonas TaxID=2630389 RepID=UPI002473FC16|nr:MULTISPECIES: hypothetical protein [unclassified Dysgonomonas]MDH6310154.1 hypothetical protein [Dysgonomonas sp. PF1-14]MDH6340180.1 hypothetical protein [Dysgonomonas sp. PF1-16]MDH6381711.1 hypothetical protein [Dysgonomonas sp. PFB1-18]MDH6399070.1 hypothetical protein [Dysgonomonas sp. PF1-23]
MKINYLLGLFILFSGLMLSCSDDANNDISGMKCLTKIEEMNGDGDYKLFSYNSGGKLISIEDGDEEGLQEKMTISYDGESISRIQIYDPKLYVTLDFRYKNDSVFISGEDQFRGKVNDVLVINTFANTLLKLIGNRTITYNYDDRGNITSTSYRSDKLSYDINPSFYSTTRVPFWFLNYLYEYYDFMENYAGANNILNSSYKGSIEEQYSYEYGTDKYPFKMFLTDEYDTIEYRLTY